MSSSGNLLDDSDVAEDERPGARDTASVGVSRDGVHPADLEEPDGGGGKSCFSGTRVTSGPSEESEGDEGECAGAEPKETDAGASSLGESEADGEPGDSCGPGERGRDERGASWVRSDGPSPEGKVPGIEPGTREDPAVCKTGERRGSRGARAGVRCGPGGPSGRGLRGGVASARIREAAAKWSSLTAALIVSSACDEHGEQYQ
jgi:hypothetical protein